MKPSLLFTISILTLNFLTSSSALFLLPNYTESIQSNVSLYPNHEGQLDVIWRFDHSIHLDINSFELDGQSGDFLFISDLPLTFEESILEYNGTDEVPSFLHESIISNQGLLLSWKANTTIEILSDYGTFIYFHAENAPNRGTYNFSGFDITVRDLDMMRKPPPTTTTEPTINTPEPQVAVYISKFLSCNEPQQFLVEKDLFKHSIAEIATEYCRETIGCMEFLTTDLNYTEINVPTGNGLHYCDPLWDVYKSCVEVTFAIVRVESGSYLMPTQRLEDMWTKKARQIEAKGYCPYIPPESVSELNSWVWMAAMLGLTLIFAMLFCMTWLAVSQENNYHKDSVSPEDDNVVDGITSDRMFFDRENPVYSVLAKIKKGNDDSKYLEMIHGQPNYDITDATANTYKTKVKHNELYQEQEVTFEYDNPGFGKVDGEIYGHGDVGNQTYGIQALRIPKYDDDNSDTEI